MSEPLKVFISSTHSDLENYRTATLDAITSLGSRSKEVTNWSAAPEAPIKVCLNKVSESDVVVLIIAHRYGSIPPGYEVSYTEAEYDFAKMKGIPILSFIVDPSYPWRVDDVDFEHTSLLNKFKEKVTKHQLHKLFTTSDELARLVTQALLPFLGENTKSLRQFAKNISLCQILPASELYNIPDTYTKIGENIDNLPLAIFAQRSGELKEMFSVLDPKKLDFTQSFPRDLITQIQSEFVEPTRIRTVQMRDGTDQLVYVSRNNLAELSTNILVRILAATQMRRKVFKKVNKTINKNRLPDSVEIHQDTLPQYNAQVPLTHGYQKHPVPGDFEELEGIESVGGLNRFLGISIETGSIYSVGIKDRKWVEWRPYITESIVSEFGNEKFSIYGETQFDGNFLNFAEVIRDYAFENITPNGKLRERIELHLSLNSIARLILHIAMKVLEHHESKGLHCDLKAANILITKDGPHLIDSFELEPGQFSPGYTPNWSAPEQIMGSRVSSTSDVYPLGIMLLALTSSQLVGEIRRFRVPDMKTTRNVDVFIDPSVYTHKPSEIFEDGARSRWKKLIERCLIFNQEKRISLSELVDELETLVDDNTLNGHISLEIGKGLTSCVLPCGTHSVAAIIEDSMRKMKESSNRPRTIQYEKELASPVTQIPSNFG